MINKIKFLIILSILLLSTNAFAVSRWYNATSNIGGGAGALDTLNGQNLADGDKCFVVTASGQTYIYSLDSDSALSEDSTNYSVISPDSNAGDKRWILMWSGGRVLIPDATIDQGDSSITGTLAWHVSNASGNLTTVTVLPGNHKITTNVTTPVTMFIEPKPGGIFLPDATKTITPHSPQHVIAPPTQQVFDLTNNSTTGVAFTDGGTVHPGHYGAKGDGSTDDTTPMQFALNLWKGMGNTGAAGGKLKLNPGSNYLVNTALAVVWTGDGNPDNGAVSRNLDIEGYGATITSGLSTGILLSFSVTDELVRYLSIRGVGFVGGGSEAGILKLDGGGTGTLESMYAVSLEDLTVEQFSGNGIHLSNNVFEASLIRCKSFALGTNTTGYPIYFENDAAGTVSSIDVRDCITRNGLYGLYTKTPVADVKIYGGTFLLAQEYGIRLANSLGSIVSGVHVENNWASASSHASNQAGIYVSNSGTIIGCFGTTNTYQSTLVRTFANNTISLVGNLIGGSMVDHYYIHGTAAGHVQIIGDGTYDAPDSTPVSLGRTLLFARSTSGANSSTTTRTELKSVSIGGGIIGRIGGFEVFASGKKTGSAGNKTIEIEFGSTAFTFHPAANNTEDWFLYARFYNVNSESVNRADIKGEGATTILYNDNSGGLGENTAAAMVVRIMATCADGADNIQQTYWEVNAL